MGATLGELAALIGAELLGDPEVAVSGVADLAAAGPGTIAPYIDSTRDGEARRCRAAALLVAAAHPELALPQLVCADPRRGLALLLERFQEPPPARPQGQDPRALVEEGALVDASAWVGPLAWVGRGARVGARTRVLPLAYLGEEVEVGSDCWIGPGAVLLPGCIVEDRVKVGAGAVVGGEGFGFYRDQAGWQRIPSRGAVRLGAGVELGAGCCVDRGTLGETLIGAGSKLDNLVQVGHNCQLGERVLLCAQVGLAGSAGLGSDCVLGGQAGVADHRRVGAGARVAAQSGIVHDVPAGAEVGGTPALDQRRWLRASVLFSRLAELTDELRALRREIDELRRQGEAGEELPAPSKGAE